MHAKMTAHTKNKVVTRLQGCDKVVYNVQDCDKVITMADYNLEVK